MATKHYQWCSSFCKLVILLIVSSCYFFGVATQFSMFVLLYSLRVANHSCETLRKLLHHTAFCQEELELIIISGIYILVDLSSNQ